MEKYGNPGTAEGRKRGGIESIKTHLSRESAFKRLKKVKKPRHSARLAELIGILMGDGHLGVYQVTVSTSLETDTEHAVFVSSLFQSVFGIEASTVMRRSRNVLIVTLSSKMACDYLRAVGMATGNKLTTGLYPPKWIVENESYCKAFIRGLIDTDGCVYEDRHTVKGKEYSSKCVAFTSASPDLLSFVSDQLKRWEFKPTSWGRHVRIRRQKEVLRYAHEIGFSNPKHKRKIEV